eukprot:s47_g52.t1
MSHVSDCPETCAALWDYVDSKFDVHRCFGEDGGEQIARLSAQACAHPFSFGMGLLTSLLGCCNGGTIAAFPGSLTPLSLMSIVVNPKQTRKSGITNVMNKVGDVVDAVASERASAVLGQPTRLQSTLLNTFSEAAFWQRASSSWDQRLPGEAQDKDKMRFHHSLLLGLDECYRMFRFLGLTVSNSSSSKEQGLTDSASQFNALMQSGRSSMALKVGVGHEGREVVNVAGLGNIHVGPWVSLAKGDSGSHTVAAMERILFVTGRPVSPHSALPDSLVVDDTFAKWKWVPLLSNMLPSLGLSAAALRYETAVKEFDSAEADEGRSLEAGGQEWLQPEFAIGNRDIDVPSIEGMARKVLHYFDKAHMKLTFEAEAEQLWLAYVTCFNSEAAVLRDSNDPQAARKATGPMHLAADPSEVETKQLQVQSKHVLRAYDTLTLCHSLLNLAITGRAAGKVEEPVSPAVMQMSSAERLLASVRAHRWPTSQYERFEASQVQGEEDTGEAPDAPEGELQIMSQKDRPALDIGFGPDGKSVQDPAHGEPFLSDKVPGRIQ